VCPLKYLLKDKRGLEEALDIELCKLLDRGIYILLVAFITS